MKNKKWIFLALILLNTAFIFVNSLLRIEQSEVLSDSVLTIFGIDTVDAAYEPVFLGFSFYHLVRKIAHFAEFTTLAVWWFLWLRAQFPRRLREGLILAGLLTPLVDETLQLFSGRTSSVRDVWIDIAGFSLGVILCLLFTRGKKKKKG